MRSQFRERYMMAKSVRGCCNKELDSLELSQADTFIEFCFEMECAHKYEGKDVLTEWRLHKAQYCGIMDTIIYDFGHFSRHDASHSISILETMELVIGDERIVKLSRGDLWLLLECAYSHDIGMAVTGSELYELWRNPDFKEYLLNCLSSKDPDEKEAAQYYQDMDDALRKKEYNNEEKKDKDIFSDIWPARIVNYVKWLVTGYIRRLHSKRNSLVRKRIIQLQDKKVPQRLYEMAALISELHGEDFEELLNQLNYEEKGIRAESIYPRFAAAMLRLGDVLDVENNRFSEFAVEHMTQMPYESILHKMKHESITHIVISPEVIQLEAESDDMNVCRCAQRWFDLVNKEVEDLIYGWNEIAPPALLGCTLKRSQCYVYFVNESNTRVRYELAKQKYFEVDKDKLTDLMTGTNIYSNKMDFIREYLQNAMDATRIQMWMDIKKGLYEDFIDPQIVRDENLQPFDIPKEVYDKYSVVLKVEDIPGDYENILIVIEDDGIGMEKDCISVISTIGTGWRGRKKYDRIIKEMPRWMRPTGGFGIGIQSAFMVTQSVKVLTQTSEEVSGRKITLNSPKRGSEVIAEEYVLGRHGTTVEMKVPREIFLKWNASIKKDDLVEYEAVSINNPYVSKDETVFEKEKQLFYIKEVLGQYLKQIIPRPFVNVKVKVSGYKASLFTLHEINYSKEKSALIDGKYIILNELNNSGDGRRKLEIWDCQNNVFVQISLKEGKKGRGIVCFKDVRMTETAIAPKILLDQLDFYIDFLGIKVKESMKIHRNAFREGFKFEAYVMRYLQLYLQSHFFEPEVSEICLIQMMYLNLNKEARDFYKQKIEKAKDSYSNVFLIGFTITVDTEEKKFENPDNLQVTDGSPLQTLEKAQDIGGDEFGSALAAIGNGTVKIIGKKFSLFDIYNKYFKEDPDDKDEKMFLVTTKSRESYTGEKGIFCNMSDIQNAYIRRMHSSQTDHDDIKNVEKGTENEKEKEKIMDCLLEQGVIDDDFLWKLLSQNHEFSRQKIRLTYRIKKDDPLSTIVFWQFKRKVETVDHNGSLEFFYEMSWEQRRDAFFKDYPKEYASLAVSEIPYLEKQIGDNDTFVIPPMSGKWISEYRQKMDYDRSMGRKTVSKQMFVEMVMGQDIDHPTEYFGYLMHWVMNNAVDKNVRGDAQAVWNLYCKYVYGIYDINLSPFKRITERKDEK